MPQDNVYGEWAASGEIDIFESRNDLTEVVNNLNYGNFMLKSRCVNGNLFSPLHSSSRLIVVIITPLLYVIGGKTNTIHSNSSNLLKILVARMSMSIRNILLSQVKSRHENSYQNLKISFKKKKTYPVQEPPTQTIQILMVTATRTYPTVLYRTFTPTPSSGETG